MSGHDFPKIVASGNPFPEAGPALKRELHVEGIALYSSIHSGANNNINAVSSFGVACFVHAQDCLLDPVVQLLGVPAPMAVRLKFKIEAFAYSVARYPHLIIWPMYYRVCHCFRERKTNAFDDLSRELEMLLYAVCESVPRIEACLSAQATHHKGELALTL